MAKPMGTMTRSAKPAQPKAIAVVPTPPATLPYAMAWAVVAEATDAVCCQRIETNINNMASVDVAKALRETAREGNGFTSRSDPLSSTSSCHPGNVSIRKRVTSARTMAAMLYQAC